MRIANIIATGSEVTSGQVINLNAAWIAQKLLDYNFDVQRHIAVDDEEGRILESLKAAHLMADLVIVTGGLGPTTDDLTRKIVADWSGLELKFDESEWVRIQERLKSFDLEPREGHKWQAFFPAGAEVFTNLAGTASGFSLKISKNNKESLFWFLPGPPLEIKKIWEDHLEKKLTVIGPQKTSQLLSWQFIDLAESELAHVVEPLLGPLGYAVGYRASPPLVELKVWLPNEIDSTQILAFKSIEKELKDFLHYKNNEDPMFLFFKTQFRNKDLNQFSIQDEITEGEILNRFEGLKQSKNLDFVLPKLMYSNAEFKTKKFPFLKIYQKTEDSFSFEFEPESGIKFNEDVVFRRKVSSLRQKKWACEMLYRRLLNIVEK
jgi:nicotinamide-nucleotide amidase